MVWDVILGFVLLVAGTYIGATMALRGFFGKEYYDPRTGELVEDTEESHEQFEE